MSIDGPGPVSSQQQYSRYRHSTRSTPAPGGAPAADTAISLPAIAGRNPTFDPPYHRLVYCCRRQISLRPSATAGSTASTRCGAKSRTKDSVDAGERVLALPQGLHDTLVTSSYPRSSFARRVLTTLPDESLATCLAARPTPEAVGLMLNGRRAMRRRVPAADSAPRSRSHAVP